MRRIVSVVGTVVVVVLAFLGIGGTAIFRNAPQDPFGPADAVFVLGGEHDGRESYGRQLVRDGVAPMLVLSNPYPSSDSLMRTMCNPREAQVPVICRRPEPSTTYGEALLIKELVAEHRWKRVVVVTWQYHLPRTRYVFERCFTADSAMMIMRAVPRQYRLPTALWEYIYFYQFLAFAKALATLDCSADER